ncbi:hypothetical protein DSCO28_50350 [Desulfosarcina ovata subsp. sediminis]|uniref:Uncharacterized protein n=1 Tax=Desulfosarcina ovata subsp. sediminis TaxID=885957 RepID=A0A5K7ZW43_9BACT|nr:hypothetical protein [Desulfosarcina ovata]BBO84469.1 hypothetical protein DSCO28_50350 [Desulfosarcina ovata subsp. sediminis]
MKIISAYTEQAIDNPHVDPIRLLTISLDGLTLRLCDRLFGVPGSEFVFGGQIYEPMVVSWGAIEHGRIDPESNYSTEPAEFSATIDNNTPIGGYDRISELFAAIDPAFSAVTVIELYGDDAGTADVVPFFSGEFEDLTGMTADQVSITATGADANLSKRFACNLLKKSDFPGADPDDINKMIPQAWGPVRKVQALAAEAGGKTTIVSEVTASLPWDGDTLGVSDGDYLPRGAFVLQVGREQIAIASRSGDVLTLASSGARGYNSTTISEHDAGADCAEVRSSYVYVFADHPVASIDAVFVANVRQTSGFVGYTGQDGDEYPGYDRKAVLVFSVWPVFVKQVNLTADDTIIITDTTDVADTITIDSTLDTVDTITVDNGTLDTNDTITVDNGTLDTNDTITVDNGTLEAVDTIDVDNGTLDASDTITVSNGTLATDDTITVDNGTLAVDDTIDVDNGTLSIDDTSSISNTLSISDTQDVTDSGHSHASTSTVTINWLFETVNKLSGTLYNGMSMVDGDFETHAGFDAVGTTVEITKAYYESYDGDPEQIRLCIDVDTMGPSTVLTYTFCGKTLTVDKDDEGTTVKGAWSALGTGYDTWEEINAAVGQIVQSVSSDSSYVAEVWAEIQYTPADTDDASADVSLTGSTDLSGDVTEDGGETLSGEVDKTGTATIYGTVNSDGTVTLTGAIVKDGTITLTGEIDKVGTVTFSGIINKNGTVTLTGDIGKNGTVTIDGIINKDGTVTLSGDIIKNGTVTKIGAIVKTGTVTVSGNSAADTVIGGIVNVSFTGKVDEDGSITGTVGVVIERPDHIARDILINGCGRPASVIGASYAASGSAYGSLGYRLGVVLTQRPSVRSLLNRIAFQSKSIDFWESGQHQFSFISGVGQVVKTIDQNRIDLNQIYIKKTDTTGIINALDATWNRDWSGNSDNSESDSDTVSGSDSASIVKYGRLEGEALGLSYIVDQHQAQDVVDWVISENCNPRYIVEFSGGYFLVDIERGDVVAFGADSFSEIDFLNQSLLGLVSTSNRFRVVDRRDRSDASTQLEIITIDQYLDAWGLSDVWGGSDVWGA